MDAPQLPDDFSEFLRLLNAHGVEYLLVGGYAVGIHGYPRATIDLDVWVQPTAANADRVVSALRVFGFDVPELESRLFTAPATIVRFGTPPYRIEVRTAIDGVTFDDCRRNALHVSLGDVAVPVLALDDLKTNQRASGRHKNQTALDHLPQKV